jgi:hypothetical protein
MKERKSLNPAIVLGGLLGSYFIYRALRSRNNSKVIKIKKWVNWDMKFRNDTGEQDKAKVLSSVYNYILNDLNNSGEKVVSVNFLVDGYKFKTPNFADVGVLRNRSAVSINADVEYISKAGVPVPIPPPPPPVIEGFEIVRVGIPAF